MTANLCQGHTSQNSNGAAQVNFDNGILKAAASKATFINGLFGTALNIAAGGLTIDTAGFTVGTDAASRFTGIGGLTVTGGGVFRLLADAGRERGSRGILAGLARDVGGRDEGKLPTERGLRS